MPIFAPSSRGLLFAAALAAFLLPSTTRAATASDLFARGYTVVPLPQRVDLQPSDFRFGPDWRLELGEGVAPDNAAIEILRADLAERHGIALSTDSRNTIRLVIHPGAIQPSRTLDQHAAAIAAQAYSLELAPGAITITANAPAGLFYGAETLVQLVCPRDGAFWLPAGRITDWPDLELRQIYWDDAHHLDKLPALKHAIRQAAFYKVNGFILKLEGHFLFRSAPAVVEPYALSPAEYQELTDYALRYHVQLIPYLDAPAHIAFILKHPEYAGLREYPQSNYELCMVNPAAVRLILGMFHDLLDANRGGKYVYLSTDEPYYAGLADLPGCREKEAAGKEGSPGKLLARFTAEIAADLHVRGREVIFWGEYPLKPSDVSSLPEYLINGETVGPPFDAEFRRRHIRQMFYVSAEGEEPLFPDYFALSPSRRIHPASGPSPRVQENFRKISFDSARGRSDLIGMVVAGWADRGLHPETFWLGYVAATASGWHPGAPDPSETMASFYRLFYGPAAVSMNRLYQLMSLQAQFWADSWDRAPSTLRKPVFGNSTGPFDPPRPVKDDTLALPPAPTPDLHYTSHWAQDNARRLQLTADQIEANDELAGLLLENLGRIRLNRDNLVVFLSIANLCRQNLDMIHGVARMDALLQSASTAAASKPEQALAALDEALDAAHAIWQERNRAYSDAVAVWNQTWHPRVPSANGRVFLHDLDDVKDHLPDRTVDLSYLIYRQLNLPFNEWVAAIRDARTQYARQHGLPPRSESWDWRRY